MPQITSSKIGPFFLKRTKMTDITLALSFTIIILHLISDVSNTSPWLCVAAQECKPWGYITMAQKTPPGNCDPDDDSDCCKPGRNYTTYRCSPPVSNRTKAVLQAGVFTKSIDGGGPSECDNKYHSDDTLVVSLSTGWYNKGSRCGKEILITGNGGRTARALVVDECNSYMACDAATGYQSPCGYNIVIASKAVWAALGVPQNSSLYGDMNVTWSPTLSNKTLPSHNLVQHKRNKVLVAVVVVVSVFVVTICIVVYIKKRRARYLKELDEELWENPAVLLSDQLPKRFTYKDLKSSTNDFNEQRKLGVGGFGSVFEGILNDNIGTRVAIKYLHNFKQGKKEFITEVKTMGSVHHCNLVKLVGFCAEKGRRLLVYEYMSNGSLDNWIFKGNKGSLNWEVRKKIILHVAKGLSYLHEDCENKIIHLDIKPQNILLDHNFNAKLSDFGLATLIDKEESFAITQMRGTRGYLAPEWLSRKITEKADVYSYGIVMLEVIFERMNFDVRHQENPSMVEVVRKGLEEDELSNLVKEYCRDEDMLKSIEEVEKMIKLAIWCLQAEPTRRPSMITVVKVLEGTTTLEPNIIDSSAISTIATTTGENSSITTFEISSMSLPR